MTLSIARAPSYLGAGNGVPFHTIVIKLHKRCNLACSYCYLYEMADNTYLMGPKVLSPAVIRQIALRIREHIRIHRQDQIMIILHGGEPLLAGAEIIQLLCAEIRQAVPPPTWVRFSMHTNGVLLDADMLKLLRSLRVKVSVSLDGGRQANDRYRKGPRGTSSFPAVDAALKLLADDFPDIFTGILAVISLKNKPLAIHEELMSYGPPEIDYLFPHGNYKQLPPGMVTPADATRYADYLLAIVESYPSWYDCPIQTTREILYLVLGGHTNSDALGANMGPVVIEMGDYELVDTLRSTRQGATITGLNVFQHPIDLVTAHPGIQQRLLGIQGLCETCRACPLVSGCGGGYQPHRYREENGLDNPSIYCAALKILFGAAIDYVQSIARAWLGTSKEPS